MALPLVAGLAAGAMGLLGSMRASNVNAQSVKDTNRANKEIAFANLDYQREYNEQIFAREDNAVQRRAADLEAAGLSKTLAAGSAAGAGGSAAAPQMNYQEQGTPPEQNHVLAGMTSANAVVNMVNTAQAQALANQKGKQEVIALEIQNEFMRDLLQAELDNRKSNKEYTDVQRAHQELETSVLNHDFRFAKESGMMHQSAGIVSDAVKHVLGMTDEQWKKHGHRLESLIDLMLGDIAAPLTSGGKSSSNTGHLLFDALKKSVDSKIINRLSEHDKTWSYDGR